MKRKTLYLTGAALVVPALAAALIVGRAISAGPRKPAAVLDPGKRMIEMGTENLLAGSAPFVNPKVAPGKVRWHEDFATATAAAKRSGKPVLLFQMMGKLDERFC